MLTKICEKRNCIIRLHIFLTFALISLWFIHSTWYAVFVTVIFASMGRITYLKGRQITELSLRFNNNEKMLSEIFKYVPDLIFYKDCDLKYISCNDAFVEAMCLPREEIIGKTDFDMLEKKLAKEVAGYDYQVFQTRDAVVYDQAIIAQNGDHKVYNLIKSPIFSEDGKLQGILGIARDVTVQKMLQKAFNEKQLQLSAILENMPFFAYMKDIEGNFVCGNQKVLEFFGKNPEDLVNSHVKNMFLEDVESILQEDAEIIKNKKTIRNERELVTIKGPVWMEVNKAPILDENGDVIGIVVVTKDIMLQKKIEAQKENFVATLSHDLKTPVMAQIRALDLVLKGVCGEINDDQKELIGQVRSSCHYIFEMISTLLTTYKYEEGVKKLDYAEFNFDALVGECCNEISYLLEEKKQKICINNDDAISLIHADKLEIKRVVTNLISNAISYSGKEAQINISIGGNPEEIIFSVKNQGEFIPEKELKRLFGKFVSNASKYKKIGFGLGLYLSKQIISAHSGEVFAQSVENDGNTFGFKIPAKAQIIQEVAT